MQQVSQFLTMDQLEGLNPKQFIKKSENETVCGNSTEVLKKYPDDSFNLIITSPPYEDIRKYNGFTFKFEEIARELVRVIKDGGVLCWIVDDKTNNGNISCVSMKQCLDFKELGLRLRQEIIYEKNGASFPASRTGKKLTHIYEKVYVFTKGKPSYVNLLVDKINKWAGTESRGKRSFRNVDDDLVKLNVKTKTPKKSPRTDIWRYFTGKGFTTKDTFAFNHPAIAPELLVFDLMRMFSKKNDKVLDCFAGSGTLGKIAKGLERKYYQIEVSKEYCEICDLRVKIEYDVNDYIRRSEHEHNTSRYPEAGLS